jgi:hypothetical protein
MRFDPLLRSGVHAVIVSPGFNLNSWAGISGILLNSFASHCELDYGGKNETKTAQIEQ